MEGSVKSTNTSVASTVSFDARFGCPRTPPYENWFPLADHLHVLLLNSDRSAVLMEYEDDEWDLPRFKYDNPYSVDNGRRISRFCRDMRDYFGVSSKAVYFSVALELTGTKTYIGDYSEEDDLNEYGKHWLIVVECQPDGCPEKLPLPNTGKAGWKDITFFSAWVDQDVDRKYVRTDLALQYLQPDCDLCRSITDPRLQLGWFKKAARLLEETTSEDGAEVRGNVIHEQENFVSTLMRVDSTKGWYFAKGPALGCNEVSITSEISKLFPESTPRVLAASTELNCFVNKGFENIRPDNDDVVSLVKLVRKLGELQLRSLSHIETLAHAGCPVRDLSRMIEKMKSWKSNPPIRHNFPVTTGRFLKLLEMFMDACRRLQDYKIPCTLVHGDFARSNAIYADEERDTILLYDWELACISHPFGDFYRFAEYENIPEELLNEAVEEYLRMWEPFENLERAREAYQLAWKLGFFLKLWAFEECRLRCDYQVFSQWECAFRDHVISFYERTIETKSAGSEKSE